MRMHPLLTAVSNLGVGIYNRWFFYCFPDRVAHRSPGKLLLGTRGNEWVDKDGRLWSIRPK